MADDIVHILRHGWIHHDNPSFAIIPISTLEQAASTIENLRKEIHEEKAARQDQTADDKMS